MRALLLVTTAVTLAATPATAAANDGFVENVKVLREFHGEPGGYFGWAVAELEDIDHDGVTDWISGEQGAAGGGVTWVFSGNRDGKLDLLLSAAEGDTVYLVSS